MGHRAEALAKRLEQGARALADYADGLSDAEWRMSIPQDGRSVGVIVHHVASMYPIEVQLAQTLAAAKPIAGVTWRTAWPVSTPITRTNTRPSARRKRSTFCGATAKRQQTPSAPFPTSSSTRRRRCH